MSSAKGSEFTESDLQAWLHDHLGTFTELITNLDQMSKRLEERLGSVCSKAETYLIDALGPAVQAALDRKLLNSLAALSDGGRMVSLGREFALLESPLPGRNPSADILAIQDESGAYAIIEIKISANAARQAVTELSAYAQGLGQRYLGLGSFDAIWLVVSTEYRPTLLNAIAHQVLVGDRCIVPIKAIVTVKNGKIEGVSLEIVEVRQLLDPCSTDALFSSEVFDGIAVNFPERFSAPEVALHCVSTACTRLGATGFCFEVAASEHQMNEHQYPHGLYIGTLNPFKLYRMSQQLRDILARGEATRGLPEYKKLLFNSVSEQFDIDLRACLEIRF